MSNIHLSVLFSQPIDDWTSLDFDVPPRPYGEAPFLVARESPPVDFPNGRSFYTVEESMYKGEQLSPTYSSAGNSPCYNLSSSDDEDVGGPTKHNNDQRYLCHTCGYQTLFDKEFEQHLTNDHRPAPTAVTYLRTPGGSLIAIMPPRFNPSDSKKRNRATATTTALKTASAFRSLCRPKNRWLS